VRTIWRTPWYNRIPAKTRTGRIQIVSWAGTRFLFLPVRGSPPFNNRQSTFLPVAFLVGPLAPHASKGAPGGLTFVGAKHKNRGFNCIFHILYYFMYTKFVLSPFFFAFSAIWLFGPRAWGYAAGQRNFG